MTTFMTYKEERDQLADALEAMQRELAEAKADIEREREMRNATQLELERVETVELASSQQRHQDAIRIGQKRIAARELVIQQMREALEKYGHNTYCPRKVAIDMKLKSYPECGCWIKEALSLQPTTSALDAYVAEKVKEEREECAKLVWYDMAPHEIADAIRARSDIAAINALEK